MRRLAIAAVGGQPVGVLQQHARALGRRPPLGLGQHDRFAPARGGKAPTNQLADDEEEDRRPRPTNRPA